MLCQFVGHEKDFCEKNDNLTSITTFNVEKSVLSYYFFAIAQQNLRPRKVPKDFFFIDEMHFECSGIGKAVEEDIVAHKEFDRFYFSCRRNGVVISIGCFVLPVAKPLFLFFRHEISPVPPHDNAVSCLPVALAVLKCL